jgi:hypothetical protein
MVIFDSKRELSFPMLATMIITIMERAEIKIPTLVKFF